MDIDVQRAVESLSGKIVSMGHINMAINRLENIIQTLKDVEKTSGRTLEEVIEVGIKAVQLEDQYEGPFDEIIKYLESQCR